MKEQKTHPSDELLADELRKSKGGKLGGKFLSLLGVVITSAGILLGGNIVVLIIGIVFLGLGQAAQARSKSRADRQAFDTIAPDVIGAVFENVQINPAEHILNIRDTNIPVPDHDDSSGSGYIRGTYQGLNTELCTVRMTNNSEFLREDSGVWEKNTQEVYAGQWMLCRLDREFSAWLTVWPRGKLDKLLDSSTIKTENEEFNKRFNLSSDDAQEALRILNPSRMERIMTLADTSFGKFAFNLNKDGSLYVAVHSGQGFFDPGKGRETPEQMRRRFIRELQWFTDMIDAFRPR